MKLLLALSTVAVVTALAGCAGGVGTDGGKPTVVASFYPLQYVAERVAGPHAEVTNLTTSGAEPHDLALTVQQTAELADADIAFYEQGLQPAVDEAIDQSGPEHVVETTATVPLEATDGHDVPDPHFWLDPAKLGEVAAAFEKEMAVVDPGHAVDYARNLQSLQDDLRRLDQEYRRGLADCALDTVVVSHDAFAYLSRYGPQFVAVNGLSPDAEPSPAHIAELHDLIGSAGIGTVFSETLASQEMADTIAADLGITTGVLDPIEGLGDSTADEDYLSLMRTNLAALRAANRCR